MNRAHLPMIPSLYDQQVQGIRLAAEYASVQARIDQGHEFAALMEAGGSVLLAGEWREIVTTISEPEERVTIVCTDCTEWLARRTVTRPYRPASPEGVEG